MYPFRDRPDVAVPVVWHPCEDNAERVPPTVFRPHWWEIRDNYWRDGVGTPPHKDWIIWRGPYPEKSVAPIEGTPDQWARGTLYSEYLAGVYGPMRDCVDVPVDLYFPSLLSRGNAHADITNIWTDPPSLAGKATVVAPSGEEWHDVAQLPGKATAAGLVVNHWQDRPGLVGQATAMAASFYASIYAPSAPGRATSDAVLGRTWADYPQADANAALSVALIPGGVACDGKATAFTTTTPAPIRCVAHSLHTTAVVTNVTPTETPAKATCLAAIVYLEHPP